MITTISLDASQILQWELVALVFLGIIIGFIFVLFMWRLYKTMKNIEETTTTINNFVHIPITVLSYIIDTYQQNQDTNTEPIDEKNS